MDKEEVKAPVIIQQQKSLPFIRSLPNVITKHDTDEDEESGLMFVDPEVERKKKIEQANQLKKKEATMIKLKGGSMTIPGTGSG